MFYIGQKVVYITGIHLPKGMICTIHSINVEEKYGVTLYVEEYMVNRFCADSFRPLLTDSIEYAEKLLEEITIEINEENLVTK